VGLGRLCARAVIDVATIQGFEMASSGDDGILSSVFGTAQVRYYQRNFLMHLVLGVEKDVFLPDFINRLKRNLPYERSASLTAAV
jgi:hypothetical protein